MPSDPLDLLDRTGPLVYQVLGVLLVLLVSRDSEEPRATTASWDFPERRGRSRRLQTPASLAASCLTLLHLRQRVQGHRVLKVTRDRRGLLDRPAWRGSLVPWGQLDLQGPPDHQDRRTAPAFRGRAATACRDSEAYLDHRAPPVSLDFLGNRAFRVCLGAKGQKDLEGRPGYRVWMDSPDSRARKESEESEDSRVCRGETEGRLAPRGPPGPRARWCTSRRETEDRAFQDGRDPPAPLGPKETKEQRGCQGMPPRDKKESRESSWGLMGDLSTWVALQDSRASLGVWVRRVLWVLLVLQDRRERSASPADQVDLD